jgi:hypothetical protein
MDVPLEPGDGSALYFSLAAEVTWNSGWIQLDRSYLKNGRRLRD